MMSRELVHSEVFPGDIQYLQLRMQRFYSLYSNELEISDGSILNVSEVLQQSVITSWRAGTEATGHLRARWSVTRWAPGKGPLGFAGIEAYEQPDGNTLVDFLDGYSPTSPSTGHEPIGLPFKFLCAMILELVWTKVDACAGCEPTLTQDGENSPSIQGMLTKLRWLLTSRFDENELRAFSFDLGVDYDDLPGTGTAIKALELVKHHKRRNRIPELIEVGKRQRPDIPWPRSNKF